MVYRGYITYNIPTIYFCHHFTTVVGGLVGIKPWNIQRDISILSNASACLNYKGGGLLAIGTVNLQEQAVVSLSTYGGICKFLTPDNISFIFGTEETSTKNRLIIYWKESEELWYLKNTFAGTVSVVAQSMSGFQ